MMRLSFLFGLLLLLSCVAQPIRIEVRERFHHPAFESRRLAVGSYTVVVDTAKIPSLPPLKDNRGYPLTFTISDSLFTAIERLPADSSRKLSYVTDARRLKFDVTKPAQMNARQQFEYTGRFVQLNTDFLLRVTHLEFFQIMSYERKPLNYDLLVENIYVDGTLEVWDCKTGTRVVETNLVSDGSEKLFTSSLQAALMNWVADMDAYLRNGGLNQLKNVDHIWKKGYWKRGKE